MQGLGMGWQREYSMAWMPSKRVREEDRLPETEVGWGWAEAGQTHRGVLEKKNRALQTCA